MNFEQEMEKIRKRIISLQNKGFDYGAIIGDDIVGNHFSSPK